MTEAAETAQEILGHRFGDPALLSLALTHRSVGGRNNERLEFLGDALLGMIIAEALFNRFPRADEGALTRLRASLVKKDTLASLARAVQLGRLMRLGEGEMKSGGWRRDSILANAFEAVIGAIFLDAGLEICRRRVLAVFEERIDALSDLAPAKDPKTELQEYLQGRRFPLPTYETISVTGDPHSQRFTVACRVSGLAEPVTAEGSSRRRAEQAAAEKALEGLLRVASSHSH